MKHELTVENMFSDKTTHIEHVISGASLSATDRKRMIEHVVADVTRKVLSSPGTNPLGLTITVSLDSRFESPSVLVSGTAPQYDLSEDFFKS